MIVYDQRDSLKYSKWIERICIALFNTNATLKKKLLFKEQEHNYNGDNSMLLLQLLYPNKNV